jgi:hypothetical protein
MVRSSYFTFFKKTSLKIFGHFQPMRSETYVIYANHCGDANHQANHGKSCLVYLSLFYQFAHKTTTVLHTVARINIFSF